MTLIRYGLKRPLYRLFASEQAPNFLLKGALLFQLWYGQWHRPTRDADLLGFGPNDVRTLAGIFRYICSIAVDDGIAFDPRATIDEALAIQRNKIAGRGVRLRKPERPALHQKGAGRRRCRS